MRRRLLAVICAVLLAASGLPAAAAAPHPIRVFVNGAELVPDVPPLVERGRTLVPMRAIFTALGAEVAWDSRGRTAVARRGGTTVEVTVDHPTARVNDAPHALDVPARLVEGRVLVSLRFVSEALGALVGWYGTARFISVGDAGELTPATVERVLDGNIVEVVVSGKRMRIRLAGVRSPNAADPLLPIEPFGPQSGAFARGLLPAGAPVRLEFGATGLRDGAPAAVFLPDGRLAGAVLAELGYARMLATPAGLTQYDPLLAALAEDAQRAGRGLWALDCGC